MRTQTATHATLLMRLASSRAGDEAWREFVDRYGELLRGFCRHHGLGPADADDVVQDVLLSLAKAMPGFQYDPSKGLFRSYLKTATLHAIYRKFRQEGRAQALGDVESIVTALGTDAGVDAQWEREWRAYHLRRAMRTIEAEFSDRDRAAFERYALGGEQPQRVADEMGVSIDALYQIKSRITRRLASLIERQVGEEG
ncbi:MAG TPA: sigma-70 family RNA polymerase sigma factor [Phycisphaerales bacterium]|nr:sigma-70 family RNA polymerase sigma factor [Phycisphaerales bacterium]